MNIFRPQTPYRFRPPKYSPFLARLFSKVSDTVMLRNRLNIQKVTTEGADQIVELANNGHSVLVTPNHADHADPYALSHIGRKWRIPFHFMAAREGFEKTRWITSFVLQHSGVFSVDREGADISAIKTAMKILKEGKHPLVIFPEGEIYHHHEQLAPINEGAATILLRAAGGLADQKEAYVIPTAMRYFYHPDVESTFSKRLSALEERITWKPRNHLDIVERIYRLGSGLIAIKEVEFLGHGQLGQLIDRIQNLQTNLIERMEAKHFKNKKSGTIPERVKLLRGKIRKDLFEVTQDSSPEREIELHDDLDTIFLAVQLYSYPGQYLRENPTIHRIAETILKLEEDVLGHADYGSGRQAWVRFGKPINVRKFLVDHSVDVKSGIGPMTQLLERRIQSMLEEMETFPEQSV